MLIALDYDDTYTRHPAFWLTFIEQAKKAGHSVICVTLRTPAEVALMDPQFCYQVQSIITTSSESKRLCAERWNVFPDVWIDDTPEHIVSGNYKVSLYKTHKEKS